MSTASHTPAPPQQHPTLEILAAFVDGRLRNDERRRTVEHLAACELCRGVVAETVHLIEDPALADGDGQGGSDPSDEEDESAPSLGRVLRPPHGRFRRTLPLIGALVAAGLAVLLIWTAADRVFLAHDLEAVTVADLAAPLNEDILRRGIQTVPIEPGDLKLPNPRGAGDPELLGEALLATRQTTQQAFRLGLRIAQLDAALRAGDADFAERLTDRFNDQRDLAGAELVGARSALLGAYGVRSLVVHQDLPAAIPILTQVDELLSGTLEGAPSPLDHPRWYELGKWTGAAVVAAWAGDAQWFAEPATKERLHELRQKEWGGATDPALASVTGLAVSSPGEDELLALRDALLALTEAAGNTPSDRSPDASGPTTGSPTATGDAP